MHRNLQLLLDAEINAGCASQTLRDIFHGSYKNDILKQAEITSLLAAKMRLANALTALNCLLLEVKEKETDAQV